MPTASYQVTVSFKLADGSWSQQEQPWQGGPSADWLEFPSGDVCIVPEDADFESFQVRIEFAIIAWTEDTLTEPGTVVVEVSDGIAGSQNVVLTRGDGATGWMSALIVERMTDFTELPLPDFAEYQVAESGSLAYWNGDVYLETVSIPEDSYLLDYYRYDTAARTWEHVGTIDTGSKDAGAASGLAVAGDQLYRFRNDGQRLVDNAGSTMVLHRFDRDADAFDPDPVELSAPVGTAHAVATWGDRLIVIADDAKGERFDLLVLAIDPASGTVEELGALPTEAIGIHSASVSKGVLYVHVPGDVLDASDVDRLCVCPLDDIESARLIDLPATDSDTPYSAQVAASNGDAALLGLPGILDTGEATNSDVWKVVEGRRRRSRRMSCCRREAPPSLLR